MIIILLVFNTDNPRERHDLTWPTPSGITEAQARARCEQEVQGTQLFSHCSQSQLHTNIIDSCVEDVQVCKKFICVNKSRYTASLSARGARYTAVQSLFTESTTH